MASNGSGEILKSDCEVVRILVLLAVHNGAEWLDEQVASIGRQTGDIRVEIAVCDDSSGDSTVSVLTRAADAAGLPLQWVRSELPGGGAGRNFFRLMMAVNADGYDFVSLCDQDDVWHPDKLERAVAALRSSHASGYSAAVRAVWQDGRTSVVRQSCQMTAADHLFEGAGQGCSFVLARSWFERLQSTLRDHAALLLGRVHYHDWAVYATARSQGQHWHFDDRPCMDYRQHGGNDTGARGNATALRRRLNLIRSGWYADQVQAIATLCTRIDPRDDSFAARYLRLSSGIARDDLPTRWCLAGFVLRHGRRRWADRSVLVGAALAGLLRPRFAGHTTAT